MEMQDAGASTLVSGEARLSLPGGMGGFPEKVTFELSLGGCIKLVQGRQRVHQVVGTGYAKCGGGRGCEVGREPPAPLISFGPLWVHQLLHASSWRKKREKALVLGLSSAPATASSWRGSQRSSSTWGSKESLISGPS